MNGILENKIMGIIIFTLYGIYPINYECKLESRTKQHISSLYAELVNYMILS